MPYIIFLPSAFPCFPSRSKPKASDSPRNQSRMQEDHFCEFIYRKPYVSLSISWRNITISRIPAPRSGAAGTGAGMETKRPHRARGTLNRSVRWEEPRIREKKKREDGCARARVLRTGTTSYAHREPREEERVCSPYLP